MHKNTPWVFTEVRFLCYIDSKEIVLGEMGANLIKWLNWGVLKECKYQNIPETMAGTPSPPTRGDLESCKKKKKKSKRGDPEHFGSIREDMP